MAKKKVSNKFWYITEITACVLCGREKKSKYRVYEKPKPENKQTYNEFACSEHFM